MNTRLNAKFLIVTALALFVSAQSILSQSEKSTRCVVKDIDTPTMPKCVIQPRNGELFIPKRYWMYPSFNQYGLAPFTILSFGRVYVNRTGRIVIRDVAFMDNAPDEFHHGLVRIEHEGKWGYADPTGKIIVPTQYSCALNYQNKDMHTDIGPLLCVGCRIEQQGDYKGCFGGKWFLTDSHGNLTPAPRPISAGDGS
ncbi:MAG: WG repeat-containing protein [Acidobacteriaceae bacterium]